MSGEIQLIFQRLKAEVDARNSLEVRLETEIKVGATFEQKRLEDELRLNSFHLAGRLQEATVAMLNALNQDLAVLLDGKRLILDMHWLRKWLNIFSHFRLHCIADVSCWLQRKSSMAVCCY